MTKLRRRTFVAGAIGAVAASPALANASPGDFVECKAEEFVAQIGSRVSLRDSKGRTSSVELFSVDESKQPTSRGFRKPISLLFRKSADLPLEQDVYEVAHPVLGRTKLLAVPTDHKNRFMEIVLG